MDSVDPLRFIAAFAFVIALIGLCAYGLRRYGATPAGKALLGSHPGRGRLQVLESRLLDTRRRLVLVRRDDMEHLLLLSDKGEIVVESWRRSVQDSDVSDQAKSEYHA